jgi:hypothetical protein
MEKGKEDRIAPGRSKTFLSQDIPLPCQSAIPDPNRNAFPSAAAAEVNGESNQRGD